MTTHPPNDCRAAFEAWAAKEGHDVTLFKPGEYDYGHVNDLFVAWQAAWNTRVNLTPDSSLMRLFSEPVVDVRGNPLSNGLVRVFSGDRAVPVYGDANASFPLPRPVILDSNGWAEIWVDGSKPFVVHIHDCFGKLQSITTRLGGHPTPDRDGLIATFRKEAVALPIAGGVKILTLDDIEAIMKQHFGVKP